MRLRHLFLFFLIIASPVTADEGMWLLNAPPAAELKTRHQFTISPEWLEKMQKSAVRFENGGSGSLVSKDGLVMTNHHVGSDMILKLSTPENNLLEKGYWARTREEELRCPDLELSILWETQDVTARVEAAALAAAEAIQKKLAETGSVTDEEAVGVHAARRREIAMIEKESFEQTGLKSEVVTLFKGGQYHLYRYKSYTDVRLVFAPEEAIAFFGGDTDNFEYPRYNLDCAFFRIYEDGKPLSSAQNLSWSPGGAKENELIFVFGHPGGTRRLYTAAHLAIMRDVFLPFQLSSLWRAEVRTQTFMARNDENARIARDLMSGIANSRKAYTGLLTGLQDPRLIAAKQREEAELRDRISRDPDKQFEWSDAWDAVLEIQLLHAGIYLRKYVIDRFADRGSGLLARAMQIVRLARELPKPSAERQAEFGDAALDSLYLSLYSPEPLPDALEIELLESGLARLAEVLGGDDELVMTLLNGKGLRERAAELVAGCTLKDPAARKALVGAGADALLDSPDPMIAVALALDGPQQEMRRLYEDGVEGPERGAYAKIAAAKFWAYGDKVYPDATFTLRLSYGTVKGCPDAPVPFTEFAGLYERAAARAGQKDFTLPSAWIEKKAALNLSTPFNFTCTADIIGGNSGSPVVNAKGEVVGLIFDGNLASLTGDVVYDAENNRAVAVDSRAILEALRSVYGAESLIAELTAR